MRKTKYALLLLSLCMLGCSAPASTSTGNDSGKLESLQAQVEELQKENEKLKKQLESAEETTIAETTESAITSLSINVGDTIVADTMEITINKAELTYDVLPDDTSSFYSHYAADPGSVYLHLDLDVKNLGKQNLPCDEILSATADYNNGYTYNAFAVPEDSTTGFTYSNITTIKPLETLGMHYLFECPQEVEESENPLFVNIEPNTTKDIYTLTIR